MMQLKYVNIYIQLSTHMRDSSISETYFTMEVFAMEERITAAIP